MLNVRKTAIYSIKKNTIYDLMNKMGGQSQNNTNQRSPKKLKN
jgi:hypothetical protein